MLSDFSLPSNSEGQDNDAMLQSFGSKLRLHKTSILAFSFLLAIASLLLGGILFFSTSTVFFVVQMAGFFGLGYLHALILRTNVARFTSTEKVLYSLFLGGLVFLVLTVLFVLKGSHPLFFILACGCAFVLPFAISEAASLFDQLYTLPAATWRFSADLPLQKSSTFLNSMPIRFRIEADAFSDEGRTVNFRAPVRMKLGVIFYHTVQEQNEKTESGIQLATPSGEPYEWSFSITRLGWSHYLNPEVGLIENGVKPNTLIVARRLKS